MLPLSYITKKLVLMTLINIALGTATVNSESVYQILTLDVDILIGNLNNLETTLKSFLTLVESKNHLPNQNNIIIYLQNFLIKIEIYRTSLYEYQSSLQTLIDVNNKQLILINAFSNSDWLNSNNFTVLCNKCNINTVTTLQFIKVSAEIQVSLERLANTIGDTDNELVNLINSYGTIYNNLTRFRRPAHELSISLKVLMLNLDKYEETVLIPINSKVELGTNLLKDLI